VAVVVVVAAAVVVVVAGAADSAAAPAAECEIAGAETPGDEATHTHPPSWNHHNALEFQWFGCTPIPVAVACG